ncbi:MAG TPA: hypothetical protein VMV77_12710 [Bacteroidales bacterium]|nr:hypothetical protein [Bacteroidales bacterium]
MKITITILLTSLFVLFAIWLYVRLTDNMNFGESSVLTEKVTNNNWQLDTIYDTIVVDTIVIKYDGWSRVDTVPVTGQYNVALGYKAGFANQSEPKTIKGFTPKQAYEFRRTLDSLADLHLKNN